VPGAQQTKRAWSQHEKSAHGGNSDTSDSLAPSRSGVQPSGWRRGMARHGRAATETSSGAEVTAFVTYAQVRQWAEWRRSDVLAQESVSA
jgi:hypothetical protein